METTTTTTTILKLNEQERKWLKNIAQNPIGTTYEEESLEDNKMRQIFWKALDKKIK